MSPLSLVRDHIATEKRLAKTPVPEAVCLSTIGLDGYPNARFVAVKDVSHDAVIITGPTSSLKGQEIALDPRVALTMWLPNVGIQVRIQGLAASLLRSDAELYFSQRNRNSQIVSTVSHQGEPLSDIANLESDFNHMKQELEGEIVQCPHGWGGFRITSERVEILEFSDDRFHRRTLWTLENKKWSYQMLQP